MLHLLFFMNLTGILFYMLCSIIFPYRKNILPFKCRIFIYRLNMIFFIIPFPLFLPYLRKFIKNFDVKVPFDPSLRNGSHITIRFLDNIYLMLPKPNLIFVLVLLLWVISSICLFIINTRDQKNFKQFYRTFDLLMEEELINGSINASDLVHDAKKELNVNRKIKIYTLDTLRIPHIFGLFHLKLCLPSKWDIPEQIYYIVIKHEIAHILHKDILFQFLTLIACSINGLNPVVHILKSRIARYEELFADACACTGSSKDNRLAFANALIDLSANSAITPNASIKGLWFKKDKHSLEERVIYIVQNKYIEYTPTKSAFVVTISLIMFIISAIPAISFNLPAALASNDDVITFDSVDTFDINTLSSEDMLNPLSGSEPLSKNDFYSLLNSLDFSNTDTYCIDENGTIFEIPTSNHANCQHKFFEVYISHHDQNPDGSCTVMIQKAQKCTKCKDIELVKRYASTTFNKCPH